MERLGNSVSGETSIMVMSLLPEAARLHLEQVIASAQDLTLVLRTTATAAACPLCGQRSRRVHSRYVRTMADLPWQGVVVRLRLVTRRFRCTRTACRRRIFTERLPDLVARHGRRTNRLREAQRWIGLALGAEAGARLLARLAMGASPDTLLRLIRQASAPAPPTPRVLGVDDWAWRKGQKYGTILCDLERRAPVDLLSDRTADPLAAWLKAHPGVEIISRDRSGAYADGAQQGAPQAVQVADRWHLLKNLTDTLQRLLDRKQKYLRQAAEAVARTSPPPVSEAADLANAPAAETSPTLLRTRAERDQHVRRARRLARYTQVRTLHQQGISIHKIADQLRMSRRTVRRFLRSESFPERNWPGRRPRRIDPFLPYLEQRWQEGGHNATQLWREIRARGFQGARSIVAAVVAKWRTTARAASVVTPGAAAPTAVTGTPSSRRVVWWLVRPTQDLKPEQQTYCQQLSELCADIGTAATQAKEFFRIVRERQADKLDTWLTAADESGVLELRTFAAGLRRDHAAVLAALTYRWSNGPVEGHINRLKMIKRQMYGRAEFDLLRQRVLHRV